MAHDHHLAPNAADVEAAHARDAVEAVVPVIPVVLPLVGAMMMFLLAAKGHSLGGYTAILPPERPLPTESLASPSNSKVSPLGIKAPKL